MAFLDFARRANANLGRSPEPPHRSFHTLGFISSQTQTALRGSVDGVTHCSHGCSILVKGLTIQLYQSNQIIPYSSNVVVNWKKFHHQGWYKRDTKCAEMRDTWQCVILNTTILAEAGTDPDEDREWVRAWQELRAGDQPNMPEAAQTRPANIVQG